LFSADITPLATGLWIANGVFDTVGQLALKRAAVEHDEVDERLRWLRMASRPWLWLGLSCFSVEFVLWLAFLSLVPLSTGVLLGTINIVIIMIAGRWAFAEAFTSLRVAGILLISSGVLMVGMA
jgi:drug/metabolite transporter (DMT)-like permease